MMLRGVRTACNYRKRGECSYRVQAFQTRINAERRGSIFLIGFFRVDPRQTFLRSHNRPSTPPPSLIFAYSGVGATRDGTCRTSGGPMSEVEGWSGRVDQPEEASTRRWHQWVRAVDAGAAPGVALLGFHLAGLE